MATRNQLSDVELDEISLVDRPANQHAKVLLIKRDIGKQDPAEGGDGEVCPECGEDPCVCNEEDDVEEIEMKKKTCAATEEELGKVAGVQFVIGFPEKGGSQVQSVVFDAKQWDQAKAKKWLEDHDLSAEKVDETENSLRFRQADPGQFQRFRTVAPGQQVSKQLKGSQGWMQLQQKIGQAFTRRFNPPANPGLPLNMEQEYCFIRDYFDNSVVYEKAGKLYKTDYSIDGENVTFTDPMPVEIVYSEVRKREDPELLKRLEALEHRKQDLFQRIASCAR